MLVVSPIAVYSIRRSEPTCPDITRAAVEADAHLEALAEALPRCSHSLKRAAAPSSISRAAASARSAWSGCSIGAPNTAMIPSPM